MTRRIAVPPVHPAAAIAPFDVSPPHLWTRNPSVWGASAALHLLALAMLMHRGADIVPHTIVLVEPWDIVLPILEPAPAVPHASLRPAEVDSVPVIRDVPPPVAPPETIATGSDATSSLDFITAPPGDEGAGRGAPETLPRAIRWVKPPYPEAMLRLGQEGDVRAVFTVHKDGSVDGIRSSGRREFVEAVEEAIRQTTFLPARREGRAVAMTLAVMFRFRLHGQGVSLSPEAAQPEE